MEPRRYLACLAAIVAVTVVIALQPPAQADPASGPGAAKTRTKTFGKHYLFTRDVYSRPLRACLHVVLEGDLRYTATGPSGSNTYEFKDMALLNPSIDVYLRQTCARTARSVAIGTKADLTQRWYSPYGGCTWAPTFAAGVPWSFSASVTPACTSRGRAAKRSSTPESKYATSHFGQNNSGRPMTWKRPRAVKNCLMWTATVQVYKGETGDAFAFGGKTSGICVTGSDGVPSRPYEYAPETPQLVFYRKGF